MKKLCCCVLVLLIAIVTLTACGEYTNNYSAAIMTTKSGKNEASMEFDSFEGTYNLKIKNTIEAETLSFGYKGSLAEGEINVYIGVDGEKELLFTIKGGEKVKNSILLDEKYNNKKTIYVIVESAEKCTDGNFEFSMIGIEPFNVQVNGGDDVPIGIGGKK